MIEVQNIEPTNIHIFIPLDHRTDHDKFHCFLKQGYHFFINTENNPESILLKREPAYTIFLRYDSYLKYSDLRHYYPEKKVPKNSHRGKLTVGDVKRLIDAVNSSDILTGEQIEMVVNFLKEAIRPFNPPKFTS